MSLKVLRAAAVARPVEETVTVGLPTVPPKVTVTLLSASESVELTTVEESVLTLAAASCDAAVIASFLAVAISLAVICSIFSRDSTRVVRPAIEVP